MKKLEISQKDLRYNLNLIKEKIDSSKTKMIAVVKGNGMGLDLIEYSKFLINNGVQILAVADVQEAVILRRAGIEEDILMLSEVYSNEDIEILLDNNIILTIGNLEERESINTLASEKNVIAKAHLKIDTGFGRYGFIYTNEDDIIEATKNTENLQVTGMFTHFSKAIDSKWTHIQFERFTNIMNKVNVINKEIIFHVSNSTALFLYSYRS